MNWENLAATLLASGTGTLIAASLTFLFALARFRREKAFDRRLQWYETAVRKLIDASDLLGRVVRAERNPLLPASFVQSEWESAVPILQQLPPLRAEAAMYASNEAYRVLQRAMADFAAVAAKIGAVALKRREDGLDEVYELVEASSKMMLHAALRLADDVREILGLERLTAREWGVYDRALTGHLDALERAGLSDLFSKPRAGEATEASENEPRDFAVQLGRGT